MTKEGPSKLIYADKNRFKYIGRQVEAKKMIFIPGIDEICHIFMAKENRKDRVYLESQNFQSSNYRSASYWLHKQPWKNDSLSFETTYTTYRSRYLCHIGNQKLFRYSFIHCTKVISYNIIDYSVILPFFQVLYIGRTIADAF